MLVPFDVGPASHIVGQPQSNMGLMSRVFLQCMIGHSLLHLLEKGTCSTNWGNFLNGMMPHCSSAVL